MRVIDFSDWKARRTKLASTARALLSSFETKKLTRKPRDPFERRWLEARGAGSRYAEVAPPKGERRYDIEAFASYKIEDLDDDRFRIVIEGPRRYRWLFAAKIGGLEVSAAERAAWTDDDN